MDKPKIVCLCGSTRFMDAYKIANFQESVRGKIVLSICWSLREDDELFYDYNEKTLKEIKEAFDDLHLKKIEMADEILVLNVGGCVGESTKREIEYARKLGKKVRWWEHNIPSWKRLLNRVRQKFD